MMEPPHPDANIPAKPAPTFGHKLAWGLLVLVIAALMGVSLWRKMNPPEPDLLGNRVSSGSNAPKPEDLALLGEVKNFSLVDQNGKKIDVADLKGSVWVANFIFTGCAGTCPLMTRGMAELNAELKDLPDVKLVSFSMDPEHDTPEVLKKYAEKYGAAAPRWLFLTGDKKEMYRMVREEFQLIVSDQNGTKDEPIIHSTKFILVDSNGTIRGRFDGLVPTGEGSADVQLLANAIRKLHAFGRAKGGAAQ